MVPQRVVAGEGLRGTMHANRLAQWLNKSWVLLM